MADPHNPQSYGLRANAILSDIYNRHGISEDVPIEDAAARVASKGSYGHHWDSPQQRTEAAMQYVRQGPKAQASHRWGQRGYLMSPGDAVYHHAAGRDATFLHNLVDEATTPEFRDKDAVDRWDRNHSPLHRRDMFSPNTYQNSGQHALTQGLIDAVANTDHSVGSFMHSMGDGPMTLQLAPNDSRGLGDAYGQAAAKLQFQRDSKTNNPLNQSPIRAYGMAPEEADEVDRATLEPMSAQRYAERLGGKGLMPPGFVTDGIDYATEMVDRSLPFSFLGGTRASLLADLAQDAAGNAAISNALGGKEHRTWQEFLLPHSYRPEADGQMRSGAEIKRAAELRRRLAEQQRQNKGLSGHEQDAVKQLQQEGYSPTGW